MGFISKRCLECKQSKLISEFYKDRTKKDGLCGYCKSCQRKCQSSTKAKAVRRISDKRYRQTEKGKAVHRKKTEKYRKSTKGKVVQRARLKRFYARHPNQYKAVAAVNHAVQAGKLPRPDVLQCRYCPIQAKEYHHYKGYEPEHWLDVIPVCAKCHKNCRKKIAVGASQPRSGLLF